MSRSILTDYFDEVEQQLSALSNAYVEQFTAVLLTSVRANLKLRIRFDGQYLLAVSEALIVTDQQISQIDYRYHFQDEKNQLIFRYDSTPHFPQLASFPHHKHLPEDVVVTEPPNFFSTLVEAVAYIEEAL